MASATLSSLAFVSLCVTSPALFALDHPVVIDTYTDCQTTTRDTNFGGDVTVRVRNSGNRVTYLGWGNMPAASTGLAPIRLQLHVHTVNVPGQVQVREISTGSFTESLITCNNRPSVQPTVWGTLNLTAADVGKVVSIDVTALVQRWQEIPSRNRSLAIVATPTNGVQVYFTSREGGTPAKLQFTDAAPPAGDNEATVAPSGADYSSPIDAANNAYAGDRWCADPGVVSGCRISISADTYILDETLVVPENIQVGGISSETTRLVARSGLETAVVVGAGAFGSNTFRNLSIINRQPGLAPPVTSLLAGSMSAELFLESVDLYAEGSDATALSASGMVTLSGCNLSSAADQRAVGINGPGATLAISQSSVVAAGGSSENIGITASNHLTFWNTEVIADGGTRAVGVHGPAHDETVVNVNNGTIVARASSEALGLRVGGARGAVTGTRIFAQAPSSGIAARLVSRDVPPSATIVVEGVQAEGTTVGLLLEGVGTFELNGVRATSQDTAVKFSFATSNFGETHVSRDSFFEGPRAIVVDSGTDTDTFDFRTTVFSGARQFDPVPGNTYRCTDTYDATYRLLNSQCQ